MAEKKVQEPSEEETTQPLPKLPDLLAEIERLKARIRRLDLHCFPHAVEGD